MANSQRDAKAFTVYGWSVCAWILVISFQYGFHLSALNQLQAVLSCRTQVGSGIYLGLPTCIPMSDAVFSVVTAIFTVGGLIGSMTSNLLMDGRGRKTATQASALSVLSGSALMGLSPSVPFLIVGRLLVGLGAGIGLCAGPIYLAEIAPPAIQGNVGVLTQLAVVIGIMMTQTMGLRLATPTQWRWVLLFSAILSAAQFLLSPVIVESPTWLERKGLSQELQSAARKLWGVTETNEGLDSGSDEDPLLGDPESQQEPSHSAAISVVQLLKAPELRRPLIIISSVMLSQQLSGINAVLYYSNAILSKTLPDSGPYISLGITVVNVLMTFPPIFLIERVGRKVLLQVSMTGLLVSLIAVGVGLDSGLVLLSSITIATFIMSFAIGLGPIPFVILPEVAPFHAVSALSSVGLSLNWVANFMVGLMFLPLRNALSGGDPHKEGRVFYVFAVILFMCSLVLFRFYKG